MKQLDIFGEIKVDNFADGGRPVGLEWFFMHKKVCSYISDT